MDSRFRRNDNFLIDLATATSCLRSLRSVKMTVVLFAVAVGMTIRVNMIKAGFL